MGKPKKPPKKRAKTFDETPAVKAPLPRTVSSPFYPVTDLPPVAAQEPKDSRPPPQPKKDHRRAKEVASWAAKVGGVVVAAVISGFSSYQSSKSDQEGGYEVTATVVKELQDAVKELVKQQAYTQGQLDAMRSEDAKRRGDRYNRRQPPPPDLKDKVVISDLPSDLSTAVKSKGRPMEQQILNLAPSEEFFAADEKTILDNTEKKRALAIEEAVKKRDAKVKAAEEKKIYPAAPP